MVFNCELWDNTEITKSAEYQAYRLRNVKRDRGQREELKFLSWNFSPEKI